PVKIDPAKTDEVKAEPVKNDVVKEQTPVKPAVVREDVKPAVGETSFFKPYFDQQIKTNPVSTEITVTAGIFKTTSGWQDAKYYLLMDKVEPGTIVKLTNPTNNKSVFAKVLGQMSGIKQNEGLNIRISNAAAAIMEITDTDKFILKADY
ncbi:MAG: peptide-binding protein, partial [Bacteroidetes bacterium]|nr:peptide-binding protein [Bacteroidota bacterium]